MRRFDTASRIGCLRCRFREAIVFIPPRRVAKRMKLAKFSRLRESVAPRIVVTDLPHAKPHCFAPTCAPLTVSAPFNPALAIVGYASISTDLQREKEKIKTQIELIERYCVVGSWR